MAAILTDAHGFVLRFGLITLRRKNLHDDSGDGKKDPPDRHPPPANEKPPEKPVVLSAELRFCHHLHAHVFTVTFRASHSISAPYKFIILEERA